MAYKLFDYEGNEIKLHNLQDKGPWCATGATHENVFVNKFGSLFDLIINPEKEKNKYAPDLFNKSSSKPGDLKTQNTPFFQAKERYGLNPQFAVTFNFKDFERYSLKYPNIEIYFWVSWFATEFVSKDTIKVEKMEGVWFAPFENIIEMVKAAPLHEYQQRKFDTKGNAKSSFILNLENNRFTKIV